MGSSSPSHYLFLLLGELDDWSPFSYVIRIKELSKCPNYLQKMTQLISAAFSASQVGPWQLCWSDLWTWVSWRFSQVWRSFVSLTTLFIITGETGKHTTRPDMIWSLGATPSWWAECHLWSVGSSAGAHSHTKPQRGLCPWLYCHAVVQGLRGGCTLGADHLTWRGCCSLSLWH